MRAIRRCRIVVLIAICLYSRATVRAGESETQPQMILCTTFPIYQLTRNVTKGDSAVTVELMIPATMGCPHDYALTPQDMGKIAAADILVANGLGIEDFLEKSVERANPNIIVIDSSLGARNAIAFEDGDHAQDRRDDEHGHHRHDLNAHLFTSPALSAHLVETIAGRLCAVYPAGAALYTANAAAYSERLCRLAAEMADAGKSFNNNRIVDPHETFDYLARDIGLEIVVRLQPHNQTISAARMLDVLETIKERKPAAIVVEPQSPVKVGEILAAETGLPVIRLDPVASGPVDAPLDHYETVMRTNLSVLKSALGGQ